MSLKKFDLVFRVRVVISVIIYAIFVAVGTHASIVGWRADNPTPLVVLLIVSYLLWPRRATPQGWKPATEAEEHIARTRSRTEQALRRVQLLYFFIAFFVLALLPFLMGDPIFKV